MHKLTTLGIHLRSATPGNHKTKCPKCSADRRNQNDPCLSVAVGPTTLRNGSLLPAGEAVFTCKHCGWNGTTVDAKPKKEWLKPQSELKKLSQSAIDWFAARGISNQTLLRYNITESVEFMPQVQKEVKTINFNYFLNGELINIKFRDREKNFKLVSGARLVPYGMDICLDNCTDSIIVVEGEPDALSCFEAGCKNVVSVPNGANKGSQNLAWLDEVIDLFANKKIIIGVDMDEAGESLRQELGRRFGRENCLNVEWPRKDANQVLVEMGPESVLQAIKDAKPFPVEGIEIVDQNDLLSLWEDGAPEGFNTFWENMDEHINIQPGMVTLITGIPGHGKTTWLKNLLARLSIHHGWKHMIYSGEEASAQFAAAELMSIIAEKSFFKHPFCQRLTRDDIEYLTPFVNDHFRYYSTDTQESTIEAITAKARELVRNFGVRSLVIDNMSSVERNIKGSGESRHNAVGDMMRDFRVMARSLGIHIFLVAHPKKMSKINGVYDVPTGYDVGDSSHYYNAPDYGATTYRRGDTTEIHWWKVRFKYCGTIGVDRFDFNQGTSVYRPAQKVNNGEDKTKFRGQPLQISDIRDFIGPSDNGAEV